MPVIKGIYKDGKIIPKGKLTLPDNVEVKISLKSISKVPKRKDNFKEVIEASRKTFGAIPSLPDGVEFENKIRDEIERELKRKWGEVSS